MDSRRRVLIVEDDGDSAEALVMLLERAGYECSTVNRASEAIQRLRGQGAPDAMLLDLTLADLGGDALVVALLAAGSLPPTIVISAATERALHDAARRLHASAALRKPFSTDSLLQAMASALAAAPSR